MVGRPFPREAAFGVCGEVIRRLLEDRESMYGWKIQKGKCFPTDRC